MEIPVTADPVDPFDSELEAERAYWQSRLASLEMLLRELLAKNERLRQENLMLTSAQSDHGSALTDG